MAGRLKYGYSFVIRARLHQRARTAQVNHRRQGWRNRNEISLCIRSFMVKSNAKVLKLNIS